VANSRGPETLSDLAAETGATAVSVPEAVRGGITEVVKAWNDVKVGGEAPKVGGGAPWVDRS
jgi:hypothetical protein